MLNGVSPNWVIDRASIGRAGVTWVVPLASGTCGYQPCGSQAPDATNRSSLAA